MSTHGVRHEHAAHRRRSPPPTRHLRARRPRPDGPQPLRPAPPDRAGRRPLLARPPRPPLCLVGLDGSHDQGLHCAARTLRPATGHPVITFAKDERKDAVAQRGFAAAKTPEGILFSGKAQEKTRGFRTERRHSPHGGTYPWIARSTALVNPWHLDIRDRGFGPCFLKFSRYFPCNAKVCLAGHEWRKAQLRQAGEPFKALDNSLASGADPKVAQALADGLSAAKIDALVRKWLARLPHPFTAQDRAAGGR